MHPDKLKKAVLILLLLVLVVVILKFGQPFLMPLAFAGLLSMLLLPLTRKLEGKGVNKAIATILPILMLVIFFAGLIALLAWQASGVTDSASKLEQQFSEKYQQVQAFVSDNLGISADKQKQMMKSQQSSGPGKLVGTISKIVAGIGGLATNTLLVLVYIFLMIYLRKYIKRFILRLVRNDQKENAIDILRQSQKVTQKYLGGYAVMIVGLWIMYGIGFSIAGVKNAIFFAVLCGILEIIPFVGNLAGTALTLVMVLVQGGDTNAIIGVVITYGLVQFIQSYILEPLVVGSEVNINPMFTIGGLVAAEIVWGVGGMVLAIPLMGVTKIVFDHIDPLKPFGEFMGEDKKEDTGLKKKITGLFRSKK